MLKQTPLYNKHLALNAKMVGFGGWEMPVSYPAGIIAEHTAVRTSAGLFDIGHMGLLKVEGDEGLALIQKAATNDASKLAMNQCQYSVLCNERGGTVDDILVYNLPMFHLIIANASNTEKVLAWLKNIPAKATVGRYENYSMLSLQGPAAEKIAAQVLSAPLAGLKRNHTLWWRDIIISRTGYTGEDGLELIVDLNAVGRIWDAFLQAGVQPCGLGARDTLRLEAGLPLYGHEYDDETSPVEAGYGWAVKFDKGDFIGREALKLPAKKHLVGLELVGRTIPRAGNEVVDSRQQRVGVVTSGTFSPTLKKPIALAYLTGGPGQVYVEIRGEKVPARLVDKTFVKRVK